MEDSVRYLYRRFPHHSDHSGYDQITRHLGLRFEDKLFSRPAVRRVLRPLSKRCIRSSGMPNYGELSFFDEVSAGLSMALPGSPSIYHILYGENAYRYLGLLAGFRNNHVVCTYHQPPEILETRLGKHDHLRQLDASIVVSKSQVPVVAELISPDRIHFVPHGVDTGFFRPARREVREQGYSCICVGFWLRDFAMLREVVSQTSRRSLPVRFDVVAPSSVCQEHLSDLDNVRLHCAVDEAKLLKLYQNSDISLLPVTHCTASNALLESAACGLPVIASDVGGVRDYLDTDCAIFVEKGNAQQMTQGIEELICDSPRRESLGMASGRRATQLDWPVVAEQMRQVYRQILGEP
jgi:glycosyltransferase involved in cell wall biosynthesis